MQEKTLKEPLVKLTREENMMTGEVTSEQSRIELPQMTEAVKAMYIDPRQQWLRQLWIKVAVPNLLLALGMQMVSPMTISLPLKLLLFVLVSGWSRLLDSLFLSYL